MTVMTCYITANICSCEIVLFESATILCKLYEIQSKFKYTAGRGGTRLYTVHTFDAIDVHLYVDNSNIRIRSNVVWRGKHKSEIVWR